MATPQASDIYAVPPGGKWYPTFPPGTDPAIKAAIMRLYDLVYQHQGQISILAQGVNKLQSP
jgi:hypothetical protein